MVYLVIKELSTIAEDVIMVTSSLTKDMNAKSDVIYRANAIRALCKITDVSCSKTRSRLGMVLMRFHTRRARCCRVSNGS